MATRPSRPRDARYERVAVSDRRHASWLLFCCYGNLRPRNPGCRQSQAGIARRKRRWKPEVDLVSVDCACVSTRVEKTRRFSIYQDFNRCIRLGCRTWRKWLAEAHGRRGGAQTRGIKGQGFAGLRGIRVRYQFAILVDHGRAVGRRYHSRTGPWVEVKDDAHFATAIDAPVGGIFRG